jgi:hypothetical protein
MVPKEKAARVQETTSSPSSAPAMSMINALVQKGIGNCTILLSIQIGDMSVKNSQKNRDC